MIGGPIIHVKIFTAAAHKRVRNLLSLTKKEIKSVSSQRSGH